MTTAGDLAARHQAQSRTLAAARRRTWRPYGQRPCRRHCRTHRARRFSRHGAADRCALPAELARFIAAKGSVALDGVSLTVNEVEGDTFSVLIIPHTLKVTTLGALRARRAAQSRSRPDGALCGAALEATPRALTAALVRACPALATTTRDNGAQQMAGPRRGKRDESDGKGARILIVEARFYDDIADALLAGAMKALQGSAAPRSTASACRARWKFRPRSRSRSMPRSAGAAPYDGAVALGCVIRGETIHFEIVSHQSARGLMELSVARRLPIGNGIITVDTEAQAWARARMEEQDKGGDAARAALALIALKRRLRESAEMAARRTERGAQGQQARRGAARRRAGALSDGSRRHRHQRNHGRVRKPLARRRGRGRAIPAGGSGLFPRHRRRRGARAEHGSTRRSTRRCTRGWPLKRIEAVLRAVLRAGAYELACRPDVPARVVMSEYVDVAGAFVDEDETGMVNAVLDQLAHQLRAAEFAARIAEACRWSRRDETSAEDRLIARYFRPLAKHPGALGLGDDAAVARRRRPAATSC